MLLLSASRDGERGGPQAEGKVERDGLGGAAKEETRPRRCKEEEGRFRDEASQDN